MKIFFMSFIVAIAFTLLPADAGIFKRKKKGTKVVECPTAVVDGVFVSKDCQGSTRVCPVAVEQSALLHPSCQGLTKRCPTTGSSIPPGCNSVTTMSDVNDMVTPEERQNANRCKAEGGEWDWRWNRCIIEPIGSPGEGWACTTDDKGIGTCESQEICTVVNNIRRCRTCTETITIQASDDIDDTDGSSTTGGSAGSSTGNSTGSVQ